MVNDTTEKKDEPTLRRNGAGLIKVRLQVGIGYLARKRLRVREVYPRSGIPRREARDASEGALEAEIDAKELQYTNHIA